MTKFLYTGQLTERKAVFISSVEKTAVRLRTMQPPPVSRARVSGLACASVGFDVREYDLFSVFNVFSKLIVCSYTPIMDTQRYANP